MNLSTIDLSIRSTYKCSIVSFAFSTTRQKPRRNYRNGVDVFISIGITGGGVPCIKPLWLRFNSFLCHINWSGSILKGYVKSRSQVRIIHTSSCVGRISMHKVLMNTLYKPYHRSNISSRNQCITHFQQGSHHSPNVCLWLHNRLYNISYARAFAYLIRWTTGPACRV